jgi:hypothetical protein
MSLDDGHGRGVSARDRLRASERARFEPLVEFLDQRDDVAVEHLRLVRAVDSPGARDLDLVAVPSVPATVSAGSPSYMWEMCSGWHVADVVRQDTGGADESHDVPALSASTMAP